MTGSSARWLRRTRSLPRAWLLRCVASWGRWYRPPSSGRLMTSEDELAPAALLSTRLPAVATPEDEVESALADRLARVVESAVEVLRVDSVGLMLLDQHDALRPAGFTGFAASALEQVQIEIGEGPGIDASKRAETIAVTDLAEAPCYARLWRRLANTGVRAVLASPVRVWGNVIGNLNAVRSQPHRWTETEIR